GIPVVAKRRYRNRNNASHRHSRRKWRVRFTLLHQRQRNAVFQGDGSRHRRVVVREWGSCEIAGDSRPRHRRRWNAPPPPVECPWSTILRGLGRRHCRSLAKRRHAQRNGGGAETQGHSLVTERYGGRGKLCVLFGG